MALRDLVPHLFIFIVEKNGAEWELEQSARCLHVFIAVNSRWRADSNLRSPLRAALCREGCGPQAAVQEETPCFSGQFALPVLADSVSTFTHAQA